MTVPDFAFVSYVIPHGPLPACYSEVYVPPLAALMYTYNSPLIMVKGSLRFISG